MSFLLNGLILCYSFGAALCGDDPYQGQTNIIGDWYNAEYGATEPHPPKTPISGSSNTGVVRVFTVSGHLIGTFTATDDRVYQDITNGFGKKLTSGVYIYAITHPTGFKKTGVIAVIK